VELARLAELKTLAYLADMARLEAQHQAEVIGTRQEAADHNSVTRPPGSR